MPQPFDDLFQQVQDFSDDYYNNFIPDYTDFVQSLGDMPQRPGQLDFPLDQQTIDLLNGQFPTGSAALSGGTVTITSNYVSTSSVIMITRTSLGSGTPGFLYVSAQSNGSFTISSSSNTDNSSFNYLILFPNAT